MPQRAAAASTHHFTEPDRTTFDFREDTLLPETLPLTLAVKIRTHDGNVIFGQTAQQFIMKIFAAGSCRVAVTLLKSAAALVDIFFEAVVQIFVAASLRNFGLGVELYFIH